MGIGCEDAFSVDAKGLGKLLERTCSRRLCSGDPIVKMDLRGEVVRAFPQLSEIVLHVVRGGSGAIHQALFLGRNEFASPHIMRYLATLSKGFSPLPLWHGRAKLTWGDIANEKS